MRIVIAGLVLLLMGGCVIMDSTLTLEHTPAMDAIARNPVPVFLARVTDRRRETDRIGCKKSGIGSESANLYLDVSLTDWFGGVMNEELRRAGLRLAEAQDPDAVRIEVDLLDFFIEPKTSFMSSYRIYSLVNAEVTVRFPGGRVFARRFSALAHDSALVPTDGAHEEVMESAMAIWLQNTIPDIVRLLELNGNLQARSGGWIRRQPT